MPGRARRVGARRALPRPRRLADERLVARWQPLLEVRAAVTKALEEARAAKQIASSLEARVEIAAPAAVARARCAEYAGAATPSFPGNLASLFIVSRVTVAEGAATLRCAVTARRGAKCERCWTYSRERGHAGGAPGGVRALRGGAGRPAMSER